MTARPDPGAFARDAFLAHQQHASLLRFIVCGSVDHGKSTLIGRLLYESKVLLDDQLDALRRDTSRHGTDAGELDFSLLLDGLAAEREQKITIDVAYRFFATARRKFIVADAPGHERYTRNMATGASTADAALILVDAQSGITRQTRRHAVIVSMLGVRHFVVAVNKMDLVGWSQATFRAIERELRSLADDLGIADVVCIPTAARSGDNVVARSPNMDWYRGSTLLEHLEEVPAMHAPPDLAFRMPIQWVNRPHSDFRGYSGLVASGEVHVGMPVQIAPSGQASRIERIVTFDGDLDRASAGQAVTITLTDDVDASRGDVIAEVGRSPAASDRVTARVFWMAAEPLAPGRSYVFKLGTCTAAAIVAPGLEVFDLDTHESIAADRLGANDVGHCELALDRTIAVDSYADGKDTGAFILIDRETNETVGMGCVEDTRPAVRPAGRPRLGAHVKLARWTESRARSVAKAISWRATGSIDTFLVTFVITASPKWAGSIALTEVMTKIVFYYFHERIWSLVPWGKR
jgi:sulfate adenylyltransferase large subunit